MELSLTLKYFRVGVGMMEKNSIFPALFHGWNKDPYAKIELRRHLPNGWF